MSKNTFEERFHENTHGLRHLSIGGFCPGCDECLRVAGYEPVEDWDREEGEDAWCIPGGEDYYATEEEALAVAREAFNDAVTSGDIEHEPSFSASTCDTCGTYLAGDRYLYHWIDENDEIMHGDGACSDCAMYHNNGDLPTDPDNA